MKQTGIRILSLLLALALVCSGVTPVRAYGQDASYEPLVPLSSNVTVSPLLDAAGLMPGDTNDYVTTFSEAVAVLRAGMEERQETVTVYYRTADYSEDLMEEILDAALEHTGVPTQGDYLRWNMGECRMSQGGYASPVYAYLTITYRPEYYTTARQEEQLALAVEELLDELALKDGTDYEKVCGIYDYICDNVVYDDEGYASRRGKLMYTAYAALINGKAVCQGYASLFYRLMLTLNVDARVIPGWGNDEAHGWNIVKLDEKYYNLDATWDAPRKRLGMAYQYFLCCQENFEKHTRDALYMTPEFQAAYPMDEQDYTPPVETVPGDVNGDEAVTRDDAIRVLLYVLNPSRFPMDADADFNGDNTVTRDDAIRLLLYVLNPNRFPLHAGG